MPKQKLIPDPITGELSRLLGKDLPLIGISGLGEDTVLPFGQSPKDFIEYCLYDTSDNYLGSGKIPQSQMTLQLDVGAQIRGLGYNRGSYKIVYNFLRRIGGSDSYILTKKKDKSIYIGEYIISGTGKIFAAEPAVPRDVDYNPGSRNSGENTLTEKLDSNGDRIELLVKQDKFWIQEISPSKTEIRLRPNPGIVDTDYFEDFRLLGYTCLSYSDVSGESNLTFDAQGRVATITGATITLDQAMAGGTLKIRDAFIIDYEDSPEVLGRYTPIVDTELAPAIQNLVTNGHFSGGGNVGEFVKKANSTSIIQDFPNPGHSRYTLRSDGSTGETNHYWIKVKGIPGESYILSCWTHWTDEWLDHRLLFRGSTTSTGTTKTFDDTNRGLIETKHIWDGDIGDGGGTREWERLYKNVTIPMDSVDGSLLIWLGDTNSNTNYVDGAYRYITNVQVEAGSVNGLPSPFVITERVEEEDSPTTGLITFIDNNTVEAVFSNEDGGFTDLMTDGKLTIKDAYVTDQNYDQTIEAIVIDDIPLKNPDASDILKDEGFRLSPYHGESPNDGTLVISLQVDWQFGLYHVHADGTEDTIQSNYKSNWRMYNTYTINNFGGNDKLRLESHNISGKAGMISRLEHTLATKIIYKSSDSPMDYDKQEDVDYATENPGVWNIITVDGEAYGGDVHTLHDYENGDHSFWKEKYLHSKLKDSAWIWTDEERSNQSVIWEWSPDSNVIDSIWKWWDPVLHSDAVKPSGWSDGFNYFTYGGGDNGKFTRSHWRSGWLGHHAKWIDGDGEFGGTAMKFIDQNSEFLSPNHTDYPSSELYKTGHNTDTDQPTDLAHRWLGIAQSLPHKMASQGIKPGDQITVSWNQKSDTPNKGAQVGIYHANKDVGYTNVWGAGTGEGHHPLTAEGVEYDGVQAGHAWQAEFLRYIPISKVGEWERVSYTAVVDENWDLTKRSSIYVYGHRGPEGILWVENPTIELTENKNEVNISPTTSDLVGEIVSIEGNTATLHSNYVSLAPVGAIFNNESNIQSFNTFTNFYVDYTSSVAASVPVYGSLRGDIESISGNSITLKNSYTTLGEEEGHNFENTLDINQTSAFNKWFVQYPNDNQTNLSKLLRFGPDNHHLITNFKFDTEVYPDYPHSLVYKLYKPLPDTVREHDYITIVKEMIPPKEEVVQLFPFVEEWVSDIVLRTPEFQSVTSPIGGGQIETKTYYELTTTNGGIQEDIENELLSGSLSADINVDFNLFENFIHFSSAEQRLKNFKYKLDQIQQYTDRSASLAGSNSGSTGRLSVKADPGAGAYLNISGSEASHPSFTPVSGSLTQVQSWEKKRRGVINNFDKFENYMFKQSSSYSSESIGIFHENSWPKESGVGTYSSPYILYRTSQSAAIDWYATQLVSASVYDRANKNRLKSHLPMFVQDDDENDVFLKFVDMIGHYFDDIWVFIKSMTDVYDKRDKLTEGIARNLLHPVAQSLGWEVNDGKDLISLPRYIFGMEQTGSENPWQFSGTSDKDISREIWSRIINNMPYFLKTKGTARAIKGLISCYGIPSSILKVMEYGGPSLPGNSADHMIIRKFTKALNFFGATNNTYVQNSTWSPVISGSGATNRVPDTVEFRFKAASGSNQVLVRRGDDWAIRLKDNGSSDTRGHVSFMLSGSSGYLEASSSEFPVYDGEFWSVMLTRTLSGSGAFVASDAVNQDIVYSLYTKKYDAGRSKIVYESTNTLLISGSMGAVYESYNLAYSGSATTVTIGGPQENTYFGESLSGSMMEYRNWTTALQESSFDNHVAAPIAFDGNTPSASYIDLVTRYSFDDDKDLSLSANQWFQDVTADTSFTASATPHNYTSLMGDHFTPVVDETKMKVPNFGPSGKSGNKLRIEADTRIDKFGNPELKFHESIVTPAYDDAPIDSNKLGIYFSPSKAIDEDIISSMPNLDFDQYIGDPRDQYKEQYTGLTEARNLYWQKYSGPNNFWDYLRLLKYYDSSLYKQIGKLVPARANATVGILIEPTIFERDKIIIGKKPTFEPQHYTSYINIEPVYSESAAYQTYEEKINWSNPFGINRHTMETGSYLSSSATYETMEANLTYTDPYRVNYYTQQSGSEPRGFISASGHEVTPEMLNTLPINLHDPHRLNSRKQISGSGIELSATFSSYSAPSITLSQNAAGTGSFVLRHILERPALYNIGDIDTSGWYGSDYYNSTIQVGSTKAIFEEVVQPRYERNITSQFNDEIEYFYSSSLSASMHIPYSSSFVRSDLDNRRDESIGTDRLFYLGCVQTDSSTVTDLGNRWQDNTPAVEVILVSPTKLITSDTPTTKMNAVNK